MTIWIIKDIEKRLRLSDGNYLLGGREMEDGYHDIMISKVNWWSVSGISEMAKILPLLK